MSTKVTKSTNKFKEITCFKNHPMGESPNEHSLLFCFVPFVFFVDELPF